MNDKQNNDEESASVEYLWQIKKILQKSFFHERRNRVSEVTDFP